jgi:hypothetical protein
MCSAKAVELSARVAEDSAILLKVSASFENAAKNPAACRL